VAEGKTRRSGYKAESMTIGLKDTSFDNYNKPSEGQLQGVLMLTLFVV
jgi:hypothetical protein